MSVKVHEGFCLDSARRRFHFGEHFLGDSLRDLWTSTLVGGGTGTVVDQQDGGIFRLGTPTASDSSQLDWGDIRSLHVDKKATIEARIRANGGVIDTTRRLLGLMFDVDNWILVFHSTDNTQINIYCENGGAITNENSGETIDASYHIYRIECFPTDEVHFYIDGVETSNSPITTNIPDDAGDYLQPHFFIQTNADTDPATSMDVDYVVIRQDR